MTKISKLFISHWHGDHVLGIPGLLQTLNNSEYSKTLNIYGPEGIKKKLELLFKAYDFQIEFDYKIIEIKKKEKIIDNQNYYVMAIPLDHGIPCFGFSFVEKDKRKINTFFIKKNKIPLGPKIGKLQEGKNIIFNGKKILSDDATIVVPGRKVSFIMDTFICNGCDELAKESDLLVCESVYTSKYEEKAEKYKHMTSKQAGLLANRNNVKKLILTHFSQRFKTTEEICSEAKNYFENTLCAYDLLKLKL